MVAGMQLQRHIRDISEAGGRKYRGGLVQGFYSGEGFSGVPQALPGVQWELKAESLEVPRL
ncbi:hypothetical protein N7481_000319 [Penicillium waksmanii]|uniref:uncharacterized protein n=1 Tax=Penicillium waksmanii TaxID=69791 RepID=UPI002548598E|nr:uncharacterized protein N7481_000319 [Penicillium waksmanii]KAJ5999910.1 hypothetical protein N7481_000319 [Penicillium waksmanii]